MIGFDVFGMQVRRSNRQVKVGMNFLRGKVVIS